MAANAYTKELLSSMSTKRSRQLLESIAATVSIRMVITANVITVEMQSRETA